MQKKQAISEAKRLSKEGPRVASVISNGRDYKAVPGYVDSDDELPGAYSTLYLYTPDGRQWREDR